MWLLGCLRPAQRHCNLLPPSTILYLLLFNKAAFKILYTLWKLSIHCDLVEFRRMFTQV